MTFYLMDSRNDGSFLDQPLEFTFAEVGNADCAGFPALEAFLHGFVCVDVVAVAGLGLTVGVFREHLLTASEGRGPMHEVEIEVVGSQVFERSVESSFYVIGVVRVVP